MDKRTRKDRQTIIDSLADLMGLKAVNRNLTYGKKYMNCLLSNAVVPAILLSRYIGKRVHDV